MLTPDFSFSVKPCGCSQVVVERMDGNPISDDGLRILHVCDECAKGKDGWSIVSGDKVHWGCGCVENYIIYANGEDEIVKVENCGDGKCRFKTGE